MIAWNSVYYEVLPGLLVLRQSILQEAAQDPQYRLGILLAVH